MMCNAVIKCWSSAHPMEQVTPCVDDEPGTNNTAAGRFSANRFINPSMLNSIFSPHFFYFTKLSICMVYNLVI